MVKKLWLRAGLVLSLSLAFAWGFIVSSRPNRPAEDHASQWWVAVDGAPAIGGLPSEVSARESGYRFVLVPAGEYINPSVKADREATDGEREFRVRCGRRRCRGGDWLRPWPNIDAGVTE